MFWNMVCTHYNKSRPLGCVFIFIKNLMFWDRACTHYSKSHPLGSMGRPTKSFKTKWEIIKHDVNKFVGVFNSVQA